MVIFSNGGSSVSNSESEFHQAVIAMNSSNSAKISSLRRVPSMECRILLPLFRRASKSSSKISSMTSILKQVLRLLHRYYPKLDGFSGLVLFDHRFTGGCRIYHFCDTAFPQAIARLWWLVDFGIVSFWVWLSVTGKRSRKVRPDWLVRFLTTWFQGFELKLDDFWQQFRDIGHGIHSGHNFVSIGITATFIDESSSFLKRWFGFLVFSPVEALLKNLVFLPKADKA
ncbi:hypothetical protein Tco_0627859 [Tanacetum coccineum]|uniref:Uncharacterized protein n=1 Tax=Tanacetum coccineum TaxID=301880 RepID=A0ABQ4WNL8_9ASTR